MRFALAATLVPLVLAAQTPAPASPAVQEWQKQNSASLVTYQADHAKDHDKVDKALKDLDKREDSWLSLARDFFGMTSANMMDPGYYDRQRRVRNEYRPRDDSSANELVTVRKAGDPAATVQALRSRTAILTALMPENDSAEVEARKTIFYANQTLDKFKAEDNPSLPPDQKQFVKKAIDFYDKMIRATRLRADYHAGRSKAWRDEIDAIRKQMDAATAAIKP